MTPEPRDKLTETSRVEMSLDEIGAAKGIARICRVEIDKPSKSKEQVTCTVIWVEPDDEYQARIEFSA